MTADTGLTELRVVSIYTFLRGNPAKAKEGNGKPKLALNLENVPGPFVAVLIGRHDEDEGLGRIIFNAYPSIKLKKSLASEWQEETSAPVNEWTRSTYFAIKSNPSELLQIGLRDKLSSWRVAPWAEREPVGCSRKGHGVTNHARLPYGSTPGSVRSTEVRTVRTVYRTTLISVLCTAAKKSIRPIEQIGMEAMSQNGKTLKGDVPPPPDRSTRAQGDQKQWFTTPSSIKSLFDNFPLRTYPPNELSPCDAQDATQHRLYIFTTAEGARLGSPSYNPSCLKWQVSL